MYPLPVVGKRGGRLTSERVNSPPYEGTQEERERAEYYGFNPEEHQTIRANKICQLLGEARQLGNGMVCVIPQQRRVCDYPSEQKPTLSVAYPTPRNHPDDHCICWNPDEPPRDGEDPQRIRHKGGHKGSESNA